MFSGDGAPINAKIPIYSFDGRDVLADPFWLVLIFVPHLLSLCFCYAHIFCHPPLRPQKSIWHGSNSRGVRVLDRHCEMWRADHMSVTGQSSSLTSGLLLGQQTRSCSNQYIVLCIETHKNF